LDDHAELAIALTPARLLRWILQGGRWVLGRSGKNADRPSSDEAGGQPSLPAEQAKPPEATDQQKGSVLRDIPLPSIERKSETDNQPVDRQARQVADLDEATRNRIEGANYAQKTYGKEFGKEGKFAGRRIDDVVADLRSGKINPKDVEIQYIVRDGHALILNTRSSQALNRAGIPRRDWYVKDLTGDHSRKGGEWRLNKQLKRSGLTSEGTPTVTEEATPIIEGGRP
jgi:hypothetical protein